MGGINVLIGMTEKELEKNKVAPIPERQRSSQLQRDLTEEHNMVSGVHSRMSEGPKEKAVPL